MSKKDKSKGDPVALMVTEKLNASIASTIQVISDLMGKGDVKDPAKVELLKLYNEQLRFLRKQVRDLTDTAPKTWESIAMKAFTDDK